MFKKVLFLIFIFQFGFSQERELIKGKVIYRNIDVPAANLLTKGQPKESFTSCAPKLSDALEKYCRLKGKDRGEQFFKGANRNIGYVIQKLGDRPLDTYSSSEAAALRDWLSSRNNSTPTIKENSPPSVM